MEDVPFRRHLETTVQRNGECNEPTVRSGNFPSRIGWDEAGLCNKAGLNPCIYVVTLLLYEAYDDSQRVNRGVA